MRAAAVEVTELAVIRGRHRALDAVTLSVPAAAVTTVLGPNGAGKTTLVETCEGYHRSASGAVRVLGLAPTDPALRARVGVMLQEGGVWPALGASRAVTQVAALHRDPLDVAALLELLGLGPVAHTPYRRLSGGEKQRVKLALALVGRPELVFLDEPTAGMDPHVRLAVWDLVRALRADGVTIVLTTHLLDEAEALSDQVVILAQGRVLVAGRPQDLTAGGDQQVRFRPVPGPGAPAPDLAALARALPEADVAPEPDGWVRITGPGASAAATLRWCDDTGVQAEELEVRRRSLQDVYLELTGRDP